jgi:hypothetical protein
MKSQTIDQIEVGARHGRLTFVGEKVKVDYHWILTCRCDCGSVARVRSNHWGKTQSCRSCSIKVRAQTLTRHGMTRSPTHNTWRGMIDRCTNSKHKAWPHYGGRGITVCERWRSFDNFYEDMGVRPEGRTLDRIDNDGNYEPGNCRWATMAEQKANQRPRRLSGVCMRGLHELTPENLHRVGKRHTCKACFMDYQREYKRALRAIAKREREALGRIEVAEAACSEG